MEFSVVIKEIQQVYLEKKNRRTDVHPEKT